jgi:hypothetical protein
MNTAIFKSLSFAAWPDQQKWAMLDSLQENRNRTNANVNCFPNLLDEAYPNAT